MTVLLAVLLLLGLAGPERESTSVEATVLELMKLSGIDEASYLLLSGYLEEVDRRFGAGEFSAETAEDLRDRFRAMYGPAFRSDYIHAFEENFDEHYAQEVLRWLRSPNVQRVIALPNQVMQKGGMERLNAYLNSPEGRQSMSTRVSLMQRIADRTHCAERRLEGEVNQSLAFVSIRNRFLPPEERWDKDDFEAYARQIKEDADLREGLKNGCVWPKLFIYREISDQDLLDFIQFYETPAGKWFEQTDLGAYTEAYVKAGIRWGYYEARGSVP